MPKLEIDFTEVGAPTANQVNFVQEIYELVRRTTSISMPEYTFEAYRDFIEEWKEEYYFLLSDSEEYDRYETYY